MKKALISLAALLLLSLSAAHHQKKHRRPDLTIIGFVNLTDGIGRQTAELIDAFKDELTIGFIPTYKTKYQDIPERVLSTIKHKKRRLGRVVLLEDVLTLPQHHPYKEMELVPPDDHIRIAYSMFESSRIPPEWTEILNTHFDAVAVPDPFLVKVYQDSGVTRPIFVLPLAIDISHFLKTPLKEKANDIFTFANLSTCINRKNHITLIRAFAKAFGNDPKVRLLISARSSSDTFEEGPLQEVRDLGLDNVTIRIKRLSKQDYLNLFQEIDCYVNLSKGEGFSIQPREAMALGIPAIVSDNTAQSTLCKSGLVTAVPTSGTEPALYHWGASYGDFYLCDALDAASAMREVYDNYPTYLSRKHEARKWVTQYLYDNLKPLYRTLIKPKHIALGTENTLSEETLTTTSPTLYNKYQRL